MGKKSKKGKSRAGRGARPPAGQGRSSIKARNRSKSVSSEGASMASRDEISYLSVESEPVIGTKTTTMMMTSTGATATLAPPAAVHLKADTLPISPQSVTDHDKENTVRVGSTNNDLTVPGRKQDAKPKATTVKVEETASMEPTLQAVKEAPAAMEEPTPAKKERSVMEEEGLAPGASPVPAEPKAAIVAEEPVVVAGEAEKASKVSDERKVLVLCSNLPMGKREVLANQQNAYTILKAQNIPFDTLDGSDPEKKEKRNELFGISGVRAQYPQFFILQGETTVFFGDWETFQSANECGTLAVDMGFKTAGAEPPKETAPEKDDVHHVWSSKLRDAVTPRGGVAEPAVLDVSTDDGVSEDSRGLINLSEPAAAEGNMKQKDCSCVIL